MSIMDKLKSLLVIFEGDLSLLKINSLNPEYTHHSPSLLSIAVFVKKD